MKGNEGRAAFLVSTARNAAITGAYHKWSLGIGWNNIAGQPVATTSRGKWTISHADSCAEV
jgi:hypothetical protein